MKRRCAFDACQADGAILNEAPRVIGSLGETYSGPNDWYHPGCWAAEQRRAEEAVRPILHRQPLAGGSLCPVHTGTPEPCPTCSAYIAAGL